MLQFLSVALTSANSEMLDKHTLSLKNKMDLDQMDKFLTTSLISKTWNVRPL